jgi:hypothetical protein
MTDKNLVLFKIGVYYIILAELVLIVRIDRRINPIVVGLIGSVALPLVMYWIIESYEN